MKPGQNTEAGNGCQQRDGMEEQTGLNFAALQAG
jgi:hypothetical protein